ncbi:hypothetical protein DRV60_24575 [Salmonella enterica subsp. enterica]|nr:hypothetical protein [Salmonella enterica subsp. enterica serovar Pomona]EBT1698363.1 hypothetical protein [Salmonella enterica]ECC6794799.1 hypothetical protein [Salmonella enterica]ECJ2879635.1 hypothetical protein [Salmonella enterica subsp. enterica serovar Pomona]EDH6019025.1 hypothetical protein [Salmonella enterica subsp. enterica serovar Pomona]
MKLFIFSLFVIVTSMVSGIAIAELSYFILLIIKYLAYGEVDFRWSEVLRGLRMGCVGGGILGFCIVLFRFLGIKGF